MRFVIRILVYLTAMIANFAAYVFLFLSLSGLSAEQSLNVMKLKLDQVRTDTLDVSGAALTPDQSNQSGGALRGATAEEMVRIEEEKRELQSRKSELETMRNEIDRLLTRKKKYDEERMYKLAKIYDGMDQAKLAEIFTQMEDTLIISVLPKMKPNNASLVLEFLPPQRSARISKILLEGS